MAPSEEWNRKCIQLLNSDPELQLYGKHFNLAFTVKIDDRQFTIKSLEGKCSWSDDEPKEPADLRIETTSEHWNKLISEKPIPAYTDLLGAAAQGYITLHGDMLHVWSHMTSLWRVFELMRKVG